MSLLLALLNNGITGTVSASIVVSSALVGVVPAVATSEAAVGSTASCFGVVPAIGLAIASTSQSCEAAGAVACAGSVESTTATSALVGAAVGVSGIVDASNESLASAQGFVAAAGTISGFVTVEILIRGAPPIVIYPLSAWVAPSERTSAIDDGTSDANVLVQPSHRRSSAWVSDQSTTANIENLASYVIITDLSTEALGEYYP